MKSLLAFFAIVFITSSLVCAVFMNAVTNDKNANQLKPVPKKNLLMTCEGDLYDRDGHWVEMICTHRDGTHSTWKRVPDLHQIAKPVPAADKQSESKPVQINEEPQ